MAPTVREFDDNLLEMLLVAVRKSSRGIAGEIRSLTERGVRRGEVHEIAGRSRIPDGLEAAVADSYCGIRKDCRDRPEIVFVANQRVRVPAKRNVERPARIQPEKPVEPGPVQIDEHRREGGGVVVNGRSVRV